MEVAGLNQDEPPRHGSASVWLQEPLIADGREWRISGHFRRDRAGERPEVTPGRIIHVLENWVVRCTTIDKDENEGLSHWGWVEVNNKTKLMQVVTSPSGDGTIESAYLNRKDLREMTRGNMGHFRDKCVRDDFEAR